MTRTKMFHLAVVLSLLVVCAASVSTSAGTRSRHTVDQELPSGAVLVFVGPLLTHGAVEGKSGKKLSYLETTIYWRSDKKEPEGKGKRIQVFYERERPSGGGGHRIDAKAMEQVHSVLFVKESAAGKISLHEKVPNAVRLLLPEREESLECAKRLFSIVLTKDKEKRIAALREILKSPDDALFEEAARYVMASLDSSAFETIVESLSPEVAEDHMLLACHCIRRLAPRLLQDSKKLPLEKASSYLETLVRLLAETKDGSKRAVALAIKGFYRPFLKQFKNHLKAPPFKKELLAKDVPQDLRKEVIFAIHAQFGRHDKRSQ